MKRNAKHRRNDFTPRSVKLQQRRIGDIIADRTRIPKNKAMELFRDARTKSANDACQLKGAHSGRALSILAAMPEECDAMKLVGQKCLGEYR